MSRLRFAHISDTHLGYRALFKADPVTGRNQRSVDIERAYATAIDDILQRDVPLVIHSGDVFHHTRPTYIAIRAFIRHTNRLSRAGIKTIVIGGNHDTPRLRTSGSVFSMLEDIMPEVTFVCGYEQETIQLDEFNLSVLAIPHGKLVDPTPPFAIPTPGTQNILVTHGLVSNVQIKGRQREPGEEEIADVLLDESFDYIALGHYHVHNKVRHNAWYSGSTERMGFGDEDVQPGYALVELGSATGAEVTHIPLEARPMKTLAAIDGEGRSARELADLVLERVERFVEPEAMARVELRNTIRHVRRETEQILRREAAPLVWSLEVFSRTNPIIAAGGQEGDDQLPDLSIPTLFKEFVQERNYESAFAVAFEQRGLRAIDDALRAQESAAPEDSAA